ncbi:MAG: TetR/AcrR family transcriptional regulator [Bacteroidales bacterium]|nr:TetR/AcrR family transcriptional regulator [Bacteroidales bacterium]
MDKKIKSRKEAHILSAGKELFWKFGFKKVSVEEICDKAKASKMTFYRLFPNKTELAKKVLDYLIDDGMIKFREILKADCPASERMQRIIALKAEGTQEMSQVFIEDVYNDIGSDLQVYVMTRSTDAWNGIIDEFRDAQKRGVFRDDFRPELLLSLSKNMTTVLNDPYLTGLYKNPQELILELTRIMAYGIAPNNM